MPWQSLTLGDSLDKLKQEIQNKINEVQNKINELNQVLNEVNNKISALQGIVNTNDSVISALRQSGFRSIILSPQAGAWDTRLLNAVNAPSISGSFYTVAHASIAIGPNLAAIENAFNAIKDSFQQSISTPTFAPPAFSFPTSITPKLPEPKLPIDIWTETQLGELFPNVFKSISDNNDELRKKLNEAENLKQSVQQTITNLQDFLNTLNDMLNNLSTTGVYTVTLAPQQGSWLFRLQNEPGAPPSTSQFSTGFAVVGLFPNISQAQQAYDAMIKLLIS